MLPVAVAARDGSQWAAAIAARLQALQRYPAAALANRTQGIVRVLVSIDRNGDVAAATIAQTSGSRILDADALALIENAAPFPSPPSALIAGADTVQVTIPISYSIHRTA
jgi:protein TonB